ncbi:pentapeptide repeats family protein [Mycobacterium ulcerans str. Harvey]|uniref:Pentapeptide repeats family protein n=1 Tax=Mycobacterium ulcerans str. Harvey TaxID=1299332 RepID=A0ABP3API4_MYCUL|nr:pentapeptide repeats family protein [Mycobacterium ulcerans str. Harvey]
MLNFDLNIPVDIPIYLDLGSLALNGFTIPTITIDALSITDFKIGPITIPTIKGILPVIDINIGNPDGSSSIPIAIRSGLGPISIVLLDIPWRAGSETRPRPVVGLLQLRHRNRLGLRKRRRKQFGLLEHRLRRHRQFRLAELRPTTLRLGEPGQHRLGLVQQQHGGSSDRGQPLGPLQHRHGAIGVLRDSAGTIFNAGLGDLGQLNLGSGNVGDFNVGSANIGSFNVGFGNVGADNLGSGNIGSGNIGFGNAGAGLTEAFNNIGFGNVGDTNIGFGNTGIANPGDYNTGFYNTGDYNTGPANIGNFDTGAFITGNMANGVFWRADSMGQLSAHYAITVNRIPAFMTIDARSTSLSPAPSPTSRSRP